MGTFTPTVLSKLLLLILDMFSAEEQPSVKLALSEIFVVIIFQMSNVKLLIPIDKLTSTYS